MSAAFALPVTFGCSPVISARSACSSFPHHFITRRQHVIRRSSFHSAPARMTIAEGATAPDFTKADGDGKEVTLSSFQGSRNVVLYFSNGTGPGCTNQSCSFRDAAEDFAQLEAEIIAVSAQRDTTAFKRDNKLPFSVIPDPNGELQKLYGVPATLGLIPGRITFVIDKQRVVRSVYNSQFSIAAHVKTAADALNSLEK